MKIAGIICLVVGFLWISVFIAVAIVASYSYSQQVLSYWNLADKASTISQKSEYIDKFVDILENSNCKGQYNALWMNTPDNSFDENLKALKSLQGRLHEIQTMNPSSFEYQTAIQQITAQEQGEASQMLDVFEGIWYKQNHFLLWSWVGVINLVLFVLTMIAGIGLLIADY